MKTYVLDTSAIIYGFNPRLVEGVHYITPGVEAELSAGRTKSTMELSLASGSLKIRAPKPDFVTVVKARASSTGDLSVLSETDLEVVALALELDNDGREVVVVSDDYSLQNLCTLLSIEFKPMVTKGISQEFWWLLYCPACGATYEQKKGTTTCQICGHLLKRKVYSKKRINGTS
ncbi:MAG: nucleotide-binding protein [Candidatus Verstraetearchaeota archaeon]|nr:nucleotide-binding protein [Candidatus Verstraetearchaeota archaeon]